MVEGWVSGACGEETGSTGRGLGAAALALRAAGVVVALGGAAVPHAAHKRAKPHRNDITTIFDDMRSGCITFYHGREIVDRPDWLRDAVHDICDGERDGAVHANHQRLP